MVREVTNGLNPILHQIWICLLSTVATSTPVWSELGPGKLAVANRWLSTRDMDANRNELNNWLDVDYRYGAWRSGFRFEIHNPRNSRLYNDRIVQRYLQYERDWLNIRAGTFYERLGRGLVFHAFEIQSQNVDGVEQTLAVDRNIDGLNFNVTLDRFELTGIFGKPLKSLSSERGATLGGGEIQVRPLSPLMLGGSFLRYRPEDIFGSNTQIDLRAFEFGLTLDAIDVYSEIVQKRSSRTAAEANGNAIYTAVNIYSDWIGFNAEFKRYENFSSLFNNPPPLVKTHSFALLNRHTHTLNANDEIGYQLESYLSLSDSADLTFHASGADNLENSQRRRFREYFVESQTIWNDQLTSHILLDYSTDRPVGDLGRWTLATEMEWMVDRKNSLLGNVQAQRLDNENTGQFESYFILLSYSRSPWLTIALQNEWTTNAVVQGSRWTAGVLSLKVGQHHDILLTVGSQPAGLVCSGGICFFLPEFRGASLRWNLRF